MFQNLTEALKWLYGRKKSVVGLHDFQRFLDAHGNPERKLRVIHVAGTNGKGSTSNYIAEVLQTEGYRVGLFTSPHLVKHNDRIRINGVPVPDERLLELLNRYEEEFVTAGLSMFEIDFMIACVYYLEEKVDFAVIEVGLGGEFDATNTVVPEVSVITTVGYDHMAYLGNTLEEIAKAKAGIIKEGVPAVSHVKDSSARKVIKKTAEKKHAPLILVRKPRNVRLTADGVVFDYGNIRDLRLCAHALYQADNAANAIEALRVLRRSGVKIRPSSVRTGLYRAVWAGRYEKLQNDPEVILDGAHNEEGIRALADTLKAAGTPCVIVFAALKDKNTDGMIETLLSVTDDIIITEFEFSRDKAAADIAGHYPVRTVRNPQEAINEAMNHTGKTVVITGSLYFVSFVRESWKELRKGR